LNESGVSGKDEKARLQSQERQAQHGKHWQPACEMATDHHNADADALKQNKKLRNVSSN